MPSRIAQWPLAILVWVLSLGAVPLDPDSGVPEAVKTSGTKRKSWAFRPGEELHYNVRALGLQAGKAQIQVGALTERDGVSAWPLVFQARTDSIFDSIYSVKDRFVTWWDPESGRVVGADFYAEERGKRHRSRSTLDHEAGKAEVVRVQEWNRKRTVRTYDIPSGAYDIAGALFELRNRPLTPGSEETLEVFTGRKVFTLRCFVEGKEKIRVAGEERDAIVTRVQLGFDGNFASKRDLRAWFSDDERRIPLRVEADLVLGSIVIALERQR